MLFNSNEFLFLFLPITLFVYFSLQMSFVDSRWAKGSMVLASLVFYGFWSAQYLLLLLGSIALNFGIGHAIQQKEKSKSLLILGLCLNVGLLVFFKYTDFLLQNINAFWGARIPLPHLVLPLAISFFTFQQIAYLVDCYRGRLGRYSFLDYAVVVVFFPHLIAGPIIQYRDVIPQFASGAGRKFQVENFSRGFFLLFLGLGKKLLLADTLAGLANKGYDEAASLSFFHAWLVSLSYTFQLYFDFSGYSDMAVGLALMVNIQLPFNFCSPYRARSIQDFWRRWHITLSQFLRDYIYIPLGGSQGSPWRTYRNVMIVFVVGGIWHGAGWNFFLWGALHGMAMVTYLVWTRLPVRLPKVLAWFLTFQFVNLTWIFFRAEDWTQVTKVLRGMAGLEGFSFPTLAQALHPWLSWLGKVQYGQFFTVFYGTLLSPQYILLVLLVSFAIVLLGKNSIELNRDFQPNRRFAVFLGFLIFSSLMVLESQTHLSKFLYFNF